MPKKKNATRADGRIAVQVYLGRDENNKRKYKTVYGNTQKEADEKALQVKLAMRKGIDVSAMHDTFGEWADRWLRIKESEVKNGQYAAYKSAVDSLKRFIGNSEISKLRAADFQDIFIDLAKKNDNTGKPSSKQTLRIRRIAASNIMQLAIDNRVLEYNPVLATKLPKTKPPESRRALFDHEQRWIIDFPHRARRSAMIMMYAGLRRGELIPLTWSDIDLKKGIIDVNKSVECVKGHFILHEDEAKSKSSLRKVKIPKRLIEFLRNEKKESLLVSVSARNTMHTESSWNSMWDSYLRDLNLEYGEFGPFRKKKNGKEFKSKFDPEGVPFVIPHFTPHWLRHTFATLLYLSGVDVLTAMKQLGHSDIKTTLAVYTHLDEIYKDKAMGKLDDYLNKQEGNREGNALDAFLDDASHVQVKEDWISVDI